MTFEPAGGTVLGGGVLVTTRPLPVVGGPVSTVGLVGLAGLEPLPIEPPLADPVGAAPDVGGLPVVAGAVWEAVVEL